MFGRFQPLGLDSEVYRTEGLPAAMFLRAVPKGDPDFPSFLLRDTWAAVAQADHVGLIEQVRRAPEVRVIRGTVAQADNLDYLRDLVGLTHCLLDRGGLAVVDVLAFKWWTPATFLHQIVLPRRPMPFQHVSILQSVQPDGNLWMHTRGMRLFGRPDVSIRNVPPEELAAAVDCINQLIERFTEGGVIEEGARVNTGLAMADARVHHRGDLDDPAFNNVYIEVVR